MDDAILNSVNNILKNKGASTYVVNGVIVKGYPKPLTTQKNYDFFGSDTDYKTSIVISAIHSPIATKNARVIANGVEYKILDIEDGEYVLTLHLKGIK